MITRSILVIAAILIFYPCVPASAENQSNNGQTQENLIERQSETAEVKGIEEQLQKYTDKEFNELLDDYDPKGFISDSAKGKFKLDIRSLINKAVQFLLKEIFDNIHILLKLMVLSVICAVLNNLQVSFLKESVGELAFYVCYIVVVSIAIAGFNSAATLGISIVDSMVDFMYATIPVLITLLVAGGNITSGGIFQPIILTVVEIAATIIKNVFIPLIFLSTLLSIVNNISEKVQLSRLAGLIKQIGLWTLGIVMTVFIAIVTVQGTMGAMVDGVASKTAKFALGAFIPVAGKYLADAADTVLGCTLLIKNAAGLAVMIGIAGICLIPLLKIAAIAGLYKLAAAIMEPVAEKRITSVISDISGSMLLILGVTAAVAAMFLISVTAIISAGNLSGMIR